MNEKKCVRYERVCSVLPALPVRAMRSTNESMRDRAHRILTDRKAWTISALTELRGLSLITTKICSSFSKPMKFPNHDFLASLAARQENPCEQRHKAAEKTRNKDKHAALYRENQPRCSNHFPSVGLTLDLTQVLDWTCLLMWELKETIHSYN